MSIFGRRNSVITYTVNKATNRDMYITVQNGEVVVNAPWYFTSNKIQQIVQEKKNWILSKMQEYNEISDMTNQVFEMRLSNIEDFLFRLEGYIRSHN